MFSRRSVSGRTVTIRSNLVPFGVAVALAILAGWSKELDAPKALTSACSLGAFALIAVKFVGDWKITRELSRAMKRGNVTSTGSMWSLKTPMTHTFQLPEDEVDDTR